MQALLPAPPERRDVDALDLFRAAVRKIDVDQYAFTHAASEHAPNDVRRKAQTGFPEWRLAAARFVGLRQRYGGNAEHGAFHGAGDRAGIDHILADIAAAIDAGQDQIDLLAIQHMP